MNNSYGNGGNSLNKMFFTRFNSELKYNQKNMMATFEYLGMSLPRKDITRKMSNEQMMNDVLKRNRNYDNIHNVMYMQEFPKGKNRIVILSELDRYE